MPLSCGPKATVRGIRGSSGVDVDNGRLGRVDDIRSSRENLNMLAGRMSIVIRHVGSRLVQISLRYVDAISRARGTI